MIDHVVIGISEFEASKKFYVAALEPLGYSIQMEFPKIVAFGENGKPSFWVGEGRKPGPMHVAFLAPDRAAVDVFYEAAMAAGGTDYGPPGLRPIYHGDYYGAFVLDPDGYNVEAVCHKPVG